MITKTAELISRIERRTFFAVCVFVVTAAVCAAVVADFPGKNFPVNTVITIPSGSSAKQVAQQLKQEHVIRSRSLALLIGKATGTTNHLVAGEYLFATPLTTMQVMNRIGSGRFGISRTRVTLLEGWRNSEYAEYLDQQLPEFDAAEFTRVTSDMQGYLFPDTYFFKKTATTDEIIKTLRSTFDKKTQSLDPAIGRAANRSMNDIIIMASILEREATNYDDARMISDILWSRMDAGMALQVDATLKYTTGRGSSELTITDLKTDSPWNTYTRRGLPPTAIGNPGIDMIRAAMQPLENNYVYYLHDVEGKPYYASTFAEHVANKKKYLR